MYNISIVGAGLAGCEVALQLSSYGYNVRIFDSKPTKLLPAYNYSTYAELVCNNSLGNIDTSTPLGLLLYELELFDSKLLKIAKKCSIKDNMFFAIDKKRFSQMVTNELISNGVTIINKHINHIPNDDYTIIATGPFTDSFILEELSNKYGLKHYYFSDASSPVVDIKSININDKQISKLSNDLYVVGFSNDLLRAFHEKLINSKHRDCIGELIDFEKCQSIENLAKLGVKNLVETRLTYPNMDNPCLLLRRENGLENGFILVGCMTTLSHKEQKNVFSVLPGFENVRFVKYGRMHQNTFLHSPGFLNGFYQINNSNIFVVGQLSGIDGYAPAISSGLVAALKIVYGDKLPAIPKHTMIGGLANYISNIQITDFQPMCASNALVYNYSYHQENISKKHIFSYNKQLKSLVHIFDKNIKS
ncbi:MAG: methylenetetrahydrofolate--tRNA-(uracil(54)-C(5))-methyltransferase (FADH(2)-oxidizing) TrmFO [Eubacterium sp.]|nr:methylenetetrahydrofolate--tRNA-(uracil(54)-C(5))-methyltransferase (FADH(2)-oxidizing) TrmFO [Clostridia bacterium]MCI9145258.1 methylenetetrahydrofolate--tRNA-(uracil(54)-C(5))-methyltransferase (FADH(2)-oxidizing) TrmFO [Eubacterium sp.]